MKAIYHVSAFHQGKYQRRLQTILLDAYEFDNISVPQRPAIDYLSEQPLATRSERFMIRFAQTYHSLP